MLSKLYKKPVRYVFSVHLHSVEPWPLDSTPVAIRYERGSKKKNRGCTKCALPVKAHSGKRVYGALHFDEVIQISVTLYHEGRGKASVGPYKKKIMKLSAVEKDLHDGFIYALLGDSELNLAEHASPNGLVELEIKLKCPKEVTTICRSDPVLKLTLQSWYKGACGPGSVSTNSSPVSDMPLEPSGALPDNNEPVELMDSQDVHSGTIPGRMTKEQVHSLKGFGSGIKVSKVDESGIVAVSAPRHGAEAAVTTSATRGNKGTTKAQNMNSAPEVAESVSDSVESMKLAGKTTGKDSQVTQAKTQATTEMFFLDDEELEKSRTKYVVKDKAKSVAKEDVSTAASKSVNQSPRPPALDSIPEGEDKGSKKFESPKVFLPREPWLMQLFSMLVCCPAPGRPGDHE